jgi:hypothetical protein
VPVSVLSFVAGTVIRLENVRSKLSSPSAKLVKDLVQIAASPFGIYAAFKDKDQMQKVADDLPIPIQVRNPKHPDCQPYLSIILFF